MMKLLLVSAGLCVVGCLCLVKCAYGVVDPVPVAEDAGSEAGEDAALDTGIDSAPYYPYCVENTNPTICIDFIENGPDTFPVGVPIMQYSILCQDPSIQEYGGCQIWSLSPTLYSTTTWAQCCEGPPSALMTVHRTKSKDW